METTPLEALHRSIIKSITEGTLKKDYSGFVKECRKINVSTYTLNVLIAKVTDNLDTQYPDIDPGTIEKIDNNSNGMPIQPEEETSHEEDSDQSKSKMMKIIIATAVVIILIIAIAFIPG